MTSLAAALGMLPLALGLGAVNMLKPLAIAVIGAVVRVGASVADRDAGDLRSVVASAAEGLRRAGEGGIAISTDSQIQSI